MTHLVKGVLAAQRHHVLRRLDLQTEPHLYMCRIQKVRLKLGQRKVGLSGEEVSVD